MQQALSGTVDDQVAVQLLHQRIIVLGTEVDDPIANRICGQLLLLSAEDPQSTIRSAAGMLLPETGWTFDLLGGAGGPSHTPGDYLVRDGLMLNQVNAGLWFVMRVEGTPQADLRPLGAPLPTSKGPTCATPGATC